MNYSNMKLFGALILVSSMSFTANFAMGASKKAKSSKKVKTIKNSRVQEHEQAYTEIPENTEDIMYKPKVLCIQKDKKPKFVDLDVAIKELEAKLRNKGVDVDALYENFDFNSALNVTNRLDSKRIYSWARAWYHFKKAAVQLKDGAIIVAWLTADLIRTKIYPAVFGDPVENLKQVTEVAQEAGDLVEKVGSLKRKKRYEESSEQEFADVLKQWEPDHRTAAAAA